jgi:hypothetical protein
MLIEKMDEDKPIENSTDRYKIEKTNVGIVLHPKDTHKTTLIWLHDHIEGTDIGKTSAVRMFLEKRRMNLPEGCKIILPSIPKHTDPFFGSKPKFSWFEKYEKDEEVKYPGSGPADKAITCMYNQDHI